MRQPRNFQPNRCYHLISRVANRDFYLSEEERTRFVERMRRVAYFSCIEVLAYCVMSNHFHVLVYVPAPRELSEEEILARVRTLYVGARLSDIMKEWDAIVKGGETVRRESFLGRYVRRMWNTSEFMKTLKQSTSQSFNARLWHDGAMWGARFRAHEIMPDEKAKLMKVAGYIDRNPVKAGIVKWPDAYKWCGFAAACSGDVRAQEGYRFIYTFGPVDWARAKELHEISIGMALKELDDDLEAKSADGSHGGSRLSVSAEKLDLIKERRWAELEPSFPTHVPQLLPRGNKRVARDILAILAEGPKRPSDLRRKLGISSTNYFTSCYLTPLAAAGYIAATGASHSPQRAYHLTEKGQKVLP